MKIKNLLLFAAAASLSISAFADEKATGELAFQADGTPAMVGQTTNDHLFVRGDYDDSGAMLTLDNSVSFKNGSPQVVALWLDDDEIYLNDKVQALTPVACDEDGNLYNEITYNSAQLDIYLPMSMQLVTHKFPGENRKVKAAQGDRMPWDASIDWSDKGTKEIDGMTYHVYTLVISNTQNDYCHFSGKDGEMYAESGALKKDDAALLFIAVQNDNQDQAEGRLAQDMILANQEFGFREALIAGWTPNDYRFIYGEGGNNESQRFQYYNRVALYGSTSVVENLAEKTISSVKYYNVAGMESNVPFDGVNIEVTTYNDGTTHTCKVIK